MFFYWFFICLFVLSGRDPSNPKRVDTLIKAQRSTSAKHAAIALGSGQLNSPAELSTSYPVLKLRKKGNSNGPRQAKGCFCRFVLHKSIINLHYEKCEAMAILFLPVPLPLEVERGIQSKPTDALASGIYKKRN